MERILGWSKHLGFSIRCKGKTRIKFLANSISFSWARQVVTVVKDSPANAGDAREDGLDLWVRKIPWNRKRQSIPVFLPGKFCGQSSLVGYSPWDRRELDTTEQLSTTQYLFLRSVELAFYR